MALLTEQAILLALAGLTATHERTYWVAYSGGLDSQVLLSLLHSTIPRRQLRALHINHGLHPEADNWQLHCRQYCEGQGIAFEARKVVVDRTASSLERQARESRYQIFESVLEPDDILLMAHHQDDQMETVLYRLLRGSGPRGMAGIPAQRKIGKGLLIRPLLNFSKAELTEYARVNDLQWIEDSSNLDTNFDRNFLRQEIIPRLKMRWPDAGKSLQRSAELSRESESLLQELAAMDSGLLQNNPETSFPVAILARLDHARQRNVLRYWFQSLSEKYAVPVPGYEELHRIVDELIPAAIDASPLLGWKNGQDDIQLRRFAGRLYVLKNFSADFDPSPRHIAPGIQLDLGANLGTVSLQECAADGIPCQDDDELQIRFRSDETSAKPAGRKTRSFKKLYQDYGVPPWLRDRIPLLYVNGNLAAVGDLFVCHTEPQQTGQKQLRLNWQRQDIHCGY